ncbi:MAG: hypothetical protein H0Z18_07970 [Thermococcus sp.]|uniref:hypothetical protein n=1 Tax=Thermococcus sp. TaxID=35749 RepID=UPI001DA78D66|nr:hypothetical protein [Thermococcus sp.]MBO8175179.1 hypothetical protein [Thermococcus sp.]
MIEQIQEALVILVFSLIILYFTIIMYDIFFRPWRLVEDQLKEIDMHIETLKKGGWRAKLHSWLSMPAWRGDVEKHLNYLLGLRELKRAELELFEKMKGGRANE